MSRGRIVVVDDKPALADLVVADLEEAGYTALSAYSAEQALARVAEQAVDVVVTDLRMPGRSGTDLCRELILRDPEVPVIVMTAFGSLDAAAEAMRAGAYDFITKPFDIATLRLALDRALSHRRMRTELRRLRDDTGTRTFEGMLGMAPPMQRVFELIERLAPTDAPILLSGESGTGKEQIARALHRRSLRADGPFVALNCAALPTNLLESELFGHEKGAYTGANERRLGLLRQAHRGTLFLDEIGDMALELQPKLLRALQEGRVRPLGSDREHAVDVRVISASHHDLDNDIRTQRFRSDLFFRLAVMRIDVPPLRERGDDVLLLAEHFIEQFADRRGLSPTPELDPGAEMALRGYSWPGNVRELRNWMEHAVALCDDVRISVAHLPRPIDRSAGAGNKTSSPTTTVEPTVPEQFESLELFEHRYIVRVLDAVGGNKTRAAKILGIDRKTLLARLQRHQPE
jgi:DNA-binding NtrC family response regulator